MKECKISSPGSSVYLDAQCAVISVYEDRTATIGRQIELNIAVIPAISRNPAPDPIFFIAGGPGEAATETFPSLSSAFDLLNQKRDIVLVDQRGTGGSNPLKCSTYDDEKAGAEISDEQFEKILGLCLVELNADPRYYTTSIAMDDLDQVRETMGYDKINLYGVSYGTRAALVYLRQYPDHVRTIILDGVAPPNWSIGPSVTAYGQQALDMIFTRCENENVCKSTFPDLPDKFQSILKRVKESPIDVSLTDPISGEWITYTLTYEDFANTIHLMSYLPETSALIPLIIHTAYTRDDYSLIASQALSNFATLSESISTGMRLSVLCAEDVPFYGIETVQEGYLGDLITENLDKTCQIWPQGDLPTDFKDPVESDTPVLILSGEVDPVTPPANGELAAQTLPNSLHLIAPGMGHVNIFRGCIPKIATAFIEKGTIQGLDTSCVQQIEPMPFFISFSGPPP